MPRTTDARGFVDTRNPLDGEHWLNSGLAWNWACLKNLAGGTSWLDLCGNDDGTFNSISASTGWSPDAHPGGQGSVAFNGSSSYVSTGAYASGSALIETVSAWVRSTSSSGDQTILNCNYNGSNVPVNFQLGTGGPGSGFGFYSAGWHMANFASSPAGDGKWHMVHGTYNYGTGAVEVYLDGVPSGSTTGSMGLPNGNGITIGSVPQRFGPLRGQPRRRAGLPQPHLHGGRGRGRLRAGARGYPGVYNRARRAEYGRAAAAVVFPWGNYCDPQPSRIRPTPIPY